MPDLRDEILKSLAGTIVSACVISDEDGIIAGAEAAAREAKRLGLTVTAIMADGMPVRAGDHLIDFTGPPNQVAMAEECLMGLMAKPSGIASAIRRFIERAGGSFDIVCGAWKKMPPSLKDPIRAAVLAGGGRFRICEGPFIYLDKNLVEMFGGIKASLERVASVNGHQKVVQIKGRYHSIEEEACEAARAGAAIISIDTGLASDVELVAAVLGERGLRERVRIALAGGVHLDDIDALKDVDVDILDVGREIVDAPLLDMRMEVLEINVTREERR